MLSRINLKHIFFSYACFSIFKTSSTREQDESVEWFITSLYALVQFVHFLHLFLKKLTELKFFVLFEIKIILIICNDMQNLLLKEKHKD